jgi:hypothetical protein
MSSIIYRAYQEMVAGVHLPAEVRRDEYLDHMTFQANARPLFTETFGPMPGLIDEWRGQGARPEELDFSGFRYRAPLIWGVPVNAGGWHGGPEPEVLEDTEEHIIERDSMGRRMMLVKGMATLPLPLDYPVANATDWLTIRRHFEFTEERFGADWEAQTRQKIEQGYAVRVGIPGAFWMLRDLMGDELTCLSTYTQPQLIHDILETIADTACRVLDRVSRTVQVDILNTAEDIAGKGGPMWGPDQVREFLVPYYRTVWDLLRARGARILAVDSDGDISRIIPELLSAGVNLIQPCEPVGGMDLVALRRSYGTRLAFLGGLDKFAVWKGKQAVERELEAKLPPLLRTGGCLFGLDHRIVAGTTIRNYRFYVDKVWELIEGGNP